MENGLALFAIGDFERKASGGNYITSSSLNLYFFAPASWFLLSCSPLLIFLLAFAVRCACSLETCVCRKHILSQDGAVTLLLQQAFHRHAGVLHRIIGGYLVDESH